MIRIPKCNFDIGSKELTFILGACVIESESQVLSLVKILKTLSTKLEFNFIFKASFDKANRTSIDSFRGPGIVEGLKILEKIKKEFSVPLLTDIHEISQANAASEIVDIIQIPAFLCRQTDLIVAAAKTGKIINVKKGQFLAPWDMLNVIEKIENTGNSNILITERGTCFGYNNLVVDFTSIPIMKEYGYPVIFDATHSVQLPGGQGNSSGGRRQYVSTLAKAAVAAGADAIFMEIHENPKEAKSDAATSFSLHQLELLISDLKLLANAVR